MNQYCIIVDNTNSWNVLNINLSKILLINGIGNNYLYIEINRFFKVINENIIHMFVGLFEIIFKQ